MSATNLTKNLKLSQFVASDKPSWLGDVNGDNKKIDDGYGVLAGEISKAKETASSAKSQSDANTQTLTNVNSELEDYGNRITALEAGGGTEQLEQRVNTLGTDVEALQTRADTFEENITQNGTDITALKGRVDKIEPKVKANTDNITSLQTETSGLSTSVENLTNSISKTNTTANEAKNLATQANSTASLANNTANTALSKANSLENTTVNFYSASITFTNSSKGLPVQALYTTNQIYFLPLAIKTGTSFPQNSPITIGNFQLPTVVNNVISGNGETYSEDGILFINESENVKCYLSINGQTASIIIKCNVTLSSNPRPLMLQLPTITYN